jgi:hypothetical protein
MTGEELAALAVAIEIMTPVVASETPAPAVSRWKIAARQPDLEMEELRALH